ncbi:uncharacterized protein FTOL_13202 [Fusarium torulosum]|uniref:Uncharacterized protein n=1 Tax=Fusarium torulosum TaxID=33205 RepID=A0AAE8SPL5_9HYPO|nr:uncharacterized protein FTOL_13202 [Fusarium torulosum]
MALTRLTVFHLQMTLFQLQTGHDWIALPIIGLRTLPITLLPIAGH